MSHYVQWIGLTENLQRKPQRCDDVINLFYPHKNHVWTCLTIFHIIPSKSKNQKNTCSISTVHRMHRYWVIPFFPHSPSIFHGKITIFHGEITKKPSRCRPAPWPCGNRAPTAGRTRRWRAERRCLSHIFPRRHQRCGPEHGVYLQIYG